MKTTMNLEEHNSMKEKREKKYLNFITVILIFIGICWSALNSFSQWSVIWNNNALIAW